MGKIKKIEDRKNDNLSVGSYDYEGLAHWWTYNHGYKQTAGGRMSATGNVVKSFSVEIARMYQPVKGAPVMVLISSSGYSNTTAGHIRAVESAVNHLNVMTVPNVSPYSKSDHEENLAYLFEGAYEACDKYGRARSEEAKLGWLNTYYRKISTLKAYGEYFKKRGSATYKKTLALPDPSGEHSREELKLLKKKMEKAKTAAASKRLRAIRAMDKELTIKADTILKSWLDGGGQMPDNKYLDKIYLRIKGAVIETTDRASISLKAAIAAYGSYLKGELKKSSDVSGFTFEGVKDGYATIGCHKVSMVEIERLLKKG